jgi:hypothetical protein
MKSKIFVFHSKKLVRRTFQLVRSSLYIDRHPDTRRSILIAGTARSGTTWLADIIASQIKCRIMFEPFQSELVPEFKAFNYFQFMQPDQPNHALYAYALKVMTGQIRSRWIDRENTQMFPEYRIIKEIRANLFLKWLHDHFPEVPLLFIIRHPCAVVLSRMELGWATDKDIAPFLQQANLVSSYLEDHMDLIQKAKYPEEKHATIWSISNLIPLEQFNKIGMKKVYYENLVTQPVVELPSIFNTIHQPYRSEVVDQAQAPSTTTVRTSAVVTGENKISRWRKVLSTQQIDRILNVVDAFGLSYLYGDSLLPMDTTE